MNKAEAVTLLREIFRVCPNLSRSDFVSLDPDNVDINSKGFYKIRLRINMDDEEKATIKPILDAHKLEMTQTKDFTIIYRSRA